MVENRTYVKAPDPRALTFTTMYVNADGIDTTYEGLEFDRCNTKDLDHLNMANSDKNLEK